MSGAWEYSQPCAPRTSEGQGVLTPVGDKSLNIGSGPNPDGRKRKRSGSDDHDDTGEPFILRVRTLRISSIRVPI